MKIIHCCLSCFYIDGYSYQENELIREHVKMGHDVLVLASTESFDDDQRKTFIKPGEYIGAEGAKVIRLPFANWLPLSLMKKLKAYKNVSGFLKSYQPDIVMFHGISSVELITIANFKKEHPAVVIYADNHADKNNSGRSIISKYFLHGFIFKAVVKFALPRIKKILCISAESKNFCSEIYKIPDIMLEFYPLGGHVFDDAEYFYRRNKLRTEYGLKDDDVLFLQTGKFDKKKKLLESLNAFLETRNSNFKYFISGRLLEPVDEDVLPLIESDQRVSLLGWSDSEGMKDLLCAADIYVQPGSQSATMQMSLCARCPVILDDVESHRIFIDGNGWLVKNADELKNAFYSVEKGLLLLEQMSERSYKISKEMLDYRKLAERILS